MARLMLSVVVAMLALQASASNLMRTEVSPQGSPASFKISKHGAPTLSGLVHTHKHSDEDEDDDSGGYELWVNGTKVPKKQDPHLADTQPDLRRKQFEEVIGDVAAAIGQGPSVSGRMTPHSPHKGKSKAFTEPYEVRQGPNGLGLFYTTDVPKGKTTWQFRSEDHFPIYRSDVPMLTDLLGKAPPEVATWLVRWTYAFPGYCDCVLLEFDDGRFTNDANGDSPTIISSPENDFNMESLKRGRKGLEMLEDYDRDALLTTSWFKPLWEKFGSDHYKDNE